MRKIIYISALAASLLAAGACKSKDERLDKAGKAVEKTSERIRDEKDELADKQRELSKERKDVDEQASEHKEKVREVEKQEGDVTAAQGAEILAREDFARASKEHLGRVDMKIRDLEARSDAKAKDAAVRLRERRDALSSKIDAIGQSSHEGWEKVKDQIVDGFDKLDKDVDAAFKGDRLSDPSKD